MNVLQERHSNRVDVGHGAHRDAIRSEHLQDLLIGTSEVRTKLVWSFVSHVSVLLLGNQVHCFIKKYVVLYLTTPPLSIRIMRT